MIKKINIIFLMITMLSPMFSCSHVVDEMYLHDAQNNYVSPYQGKWMGSYIGDTNGTIILNVSKSGNIEVVKIGKWQYRRNLFYESFRRREWCFKFISVTYFRV
ncbi:hypothetical protein D1631_00965 [Chryseobacterium nematophagum]|uniref:Lipoprotein n=1 Tax=Chryseobacterium nematophagum TaxID=2305228 RepID=A0A3M7TB55_9FLAO|nr:hypothetical protein D1631_00965 [Chryseobacterium nematophagum]